MAHSGTQPDHMQQYPNQPPAHEPQQYKPTFNQEELRVLRECNVESFYFRCVPFAAVLSSAAFLAMRKGVLSMSKRFGYTPKMMGAAFVGYFAGKFSYQNACAEKLMQLPNSPIGEALRKRKGRLGFQDTLNMEPGFSVGIGGGDAGATHMQEPVFDDHRPDVRDHNEGLVDFERGVTDALSPYTEVTSSTPQQNTSYQELRRQNREEYVNKMAERYRKLPPADLTQETDSQLPSGPSDLHPAPPPPPPPRNVKKNKYGDEVYE